MIFRPVLNFAVLVLLVLMALNGYLAFRHLKEIQSGSTRNRASSDIRANIAGISQDLSDMESGQRGYLLTEDAAYLEPYNNGKRKIAGQLANLRSELTDRSAQERSLELQLESVVTSKQAEMEKTIELRQQGYRKRAFVMVNTNEGRTYIEQAVGLLFQLGGIEDGDMARMGRESSGSLNQALSLTILANLALLVLTALLFLLFRYSGKATEQEAARSKSALQARDTELGRTSDLLSRRFPSEIALIEQNARLLLEKYEGFLPRQGTEFAEQIRAAAVELEHLRKDLLHEGKSTTGQEAA